MLTIASQTPPFKPIVFQKAGFLSLFIVCIFFSNAQQENFTDFGKADIKELLLKECDFDKGATALKLLDFQQSEVIVDYNNIKIETERRVRVKIFNEKGFEFASITIPYIGRKRVSKIKDISAYIYNLDASGNIIVRKIEKKQVFREEATNGLKKVVFTFPDLRPGSVIEYKDTKIEKNMLHFEPWFFQDRIPTLVSACRITRPSAIPLDQRFITVDTVEKKNEKKKYANYTNLTKTFTLRNVPSFRLEPMMSSVKDNLQRIEFAMTPGLFFSDNYTWNYYNRVLLRSPYFGQATENEIPDAQYIIDSAKKITDTIGKLNYIFMEVKRKIKWDDEQTLYAEDILDAWKSGSASSAEMNLILLNLCRRAGIQCYPLLVSTRNNGKTDKTFLTLSQFDGVDVAVVDSSKVYILDATQKYQSYQTPPYNVLNREALLVDAAISQWVSIVDPRPLFKNTLTALAKMNSNGEVTGEGMSYFYDFAKTEKLTYKPEEKEEEEEKKFIEKESLAIKIDSLTEEDADNELKPLKDHFRFSGQMSNSGNFYFLDPLFLSNFRKNPFNDSLRNTDIDFGSNQYYNISITVNIPDGFVVDHLPVSQKLRSEDSSILFTRSYFYEDHTVVLRNTFEVLKPIYPKDEYPILKEFFKKMYAMIAEQVVIKKQ